MGALLKFEQEAYWQECCTCGITFGMLRSWDSGLRESKKSFYCPSGHSQSYSGANEAEKLRRELDQKQRELDSATRMRQWAESEARAAKTKATKATNKLRRFETRVNAGVCPHCNRTFKQLAAHMKCKHSDEPPIQPLGVSDAT